MIDEPKKGIRFGGRAAGPVFSEIAESTLRMLMVSPDRESVSGGGFLAKIRN